MDRSERFYKIKNLLRGVGAVPTTTLLRELEVSRATLHRDLEYLRDRMDTPIVYDQVRCGYRLNDPAPEALRHELPGLWFSSREAHALLTFHHFLANLGPGLLSPHIEPLKERLQLLLESKEQTLKDIACRIRILAQAARHTEPACFQLVAHVLLACRRLSFRYHGRARGDITERTASPQRLVHYRDNWYLDA
jgi:predicted DNA-binding transcriptional regulator YafY